MKIEFYPLEVDYDNREKSTITLFGRTKDGKKLELIDDSLQPYFWVTAKKDIDRKQKILRRANKSDKSHSKKPKRPCRRRT